MDEVKDYPPYLDYPKPYKPLSNADRIRGMSDEELAETMNQKAIDTICDIVCGGECNAIATLHKTSNQVCKEIILDWLRQPYKDEGNIEISEG